MLRYGFEIYQQLIKMFVRTNKRFPNEKENKFLQNQAFRVRETLLDKNINLEELSADEAIKLFSQPPRRRKPPTAEIYKPLEFGKKTKPKKGLEALEEARVFDQFRDESTLENLYRTQEQALEDGDINTSRKIQKEIDALINKKPFGDGYKVGGVVKMIKRILSADDLKRLGKKEGIPDEDVEKFLTGEYGILKRGQARGVVKRDKDGNIVVQDKYSEKYDPIRKQMLKDDPGMFDDLFDRMFGEYEYDMYKKRGRKPMKIGGLAKTKKILDLLRKTESQLGKAPKTDIPKVRARVDADKKSIEDLANSEQIPVRDDTIKVKGEVMEDGTPDYEYYSEILDDDENQFVMGDETLEQLEAMVKERNDEMAYMYNQFKMGKLDPSPGEFSRSRLNFLKNKLEESQLSGDRRLITSDEIDELQELEKKFRKIDLEDKVQTLDKKLTDEEISELRDLTDSGYANGGLATLFEERG